jgi:hypothetical protein
VSKVGLQDLLDNHFGIFELKRQAEDKIQSTDTSLRKAPLATMMSARKVIVTNTELANTYPAPIYGDSRCGFVIMRCLGSTDHLRKGAFTTIVDSGLPKLA